MAFLDEIGLRRLWTHILAKLNTKVDKADGMGLSENNYTNDDKENLTNVINDVNALNTLVGDKSVSEQIDEAISASEKNNIGLVVIEGNPAVIENGVEGLGILATTSFSANQSGSGDPSPDNVRSISGHTSASITYSGKNFFNVVWEQGTISTTSGNDNANSTVVRTNFVPVIPNSTYAITRTIAGGSFGVRCYDDNKGFVGVGEAGITVIKGGSKNNPIVKTENTAVIKINDGVYYLRFIDYTNDINTQLMIEVGDTPTEFEPYKGNTITLNFGHTIFGGKLDWNTGLLTVTHEEIASYNNEELPLTWLSDRNVYSEGTVPTIGAQVVYELSEPYTIQLDQHQIPELSGVNTVYTNCGNNRVIFNAYLNNVINDLLVTDDGNGNVVFACSIGTTISDENTYLTVNN